MFIPTWLLKITSLCLNPLCVSLYACVSLYLAFHACEIPMMRLLVDTHVLIWALFYTVLPIMLIFGMKKTKWLNSWSAKQRHERQRLYPLTLVIYVMGYWTLGALNHLEEFLRFFALLATGLLTSLFILNFFWKASAHTAAMTAWLVCALYFLKPYSNGLYWGVSLIMVGLLALVAFARWRLKAHSRWEILLGSAVGWLCAQLSINQWMP